MRVGASIAASQQDLQPECVASGFSFPTSLAFDEEGVAYVAESGLAFGGAAPGGRIWRLRGNGNRSLLAAGLRPPVTGLAYYGGGLYVSEGGHPSRISRLDLDGRITPILENLPGPGNYHTNMVVFGPDEKLYFSQGSMTNSGVIGLDAYQLGWLRRLPHAHDLPGHDIVLCGVNFESADIGGNGSNKRVRTGAFVPFGTPTSPRQRIPKQLPCTAAVMRCNADGSELELVAWGLRNAFGMGFLPDGRLIVTDQGPDERGSRPIGGAPDLLFEVRRGAWYGWPDFVGGDAVTDPRYALASGPAPSRVLAEGAHLPAPEKALLRFPPHCCAAKFDVAPRSSPWAGHIFAALFGDERPMTAPAGSRAGRSIARIDPADWTLHPVADVPCSRPIEARFHPLDGALYVLDFGQFEMDQERRVQARAASGTLWRLWHNTDNT